jgi:hypothetical protein
MVSGGTIEMAGKLRPGVALGIDLPPFVEELRCTENGPHASKSLPYLANAPRAKIADYQGRTMYKRETAFVEVIAIAGDEDPPKSQGFRDMVLIWMPSPAIALHCQNVCVEPPQDVRGQCRKLLVGIEARFRLAPSKVINLSFELGKMTSKAFPFCCGTPRSLLPRVSPAESTSAPLRF